MRELNIELIHYMNYLHGNCRQVDVVGKSMTLRAFLWGLYCVPDEMKLFLSLPHPLSF